MLCMITAGICDYCLSTKQAKIPLYPEAFPLGKHQLLGDLGQIQNSRLETHLCTHPQEGLPIHFVFCLQYCHYFVVYFQFVMFQFSNYLGDLFPHKLT